MDRILRNVHFLGQLPLIESSVYPKLHQQHGKGAVGQTSLRLCHSVNMRGNSFDNVLWSE